MLHHSPKEKAARNLGFLAAFLFFLFSAAPTLRDQLINQKPNAHHKQDHGHDPAHALLGVAAQRATQAGALVDAR